MISHSCRRTRTALPIAIIAVLAPGTTSAASAAQRPLVACGTQSHTVARPSSCSFVESSGKSKVRLTKIKWSSWGTRKAVGHGRYEGESTTVTLSAPDRCGEGARPWFSDATFRVGGGSPSTMLLAGPCSALAASGANASAKRYVLGEVDNGLYDGIGIPKPPRFSMLVGPESFSGLRWSNWGRSRTSARGRYNDGSGSSQKVSMTATGRRSDNNCSNAGAAYSRLRVSITGGSKFTVNLCQ